MVAERPDIDSFLLVRHWSAPVGRIRQGSWVIAEMWAGQMKDVVLECVKRAPLDVKLAVRREAFESRVLRSSLSC